MERLESHTQATDIPVGPVLHALADRDVLGQAKGVVRCLTGCGEEAAFQLLVKVSKVSGCTLADVGQLIMAAVAPGLRPPPFIDVPFSQGIEILRRQDSLDAVTLEAAST